MRPRCPIGWAIRMAARASKRSDIANIGTAMAKNVGALVWIQQDSSSYTGSAAMLSTKQCNTTHAHSAGATHGCAQRSRARGARSHHVSAHPIRNASSAKANNCKKKDAACVSGGCEHRRSDLKQAQFYGKIASGIHLKFGGVRHRGHCLSTRGVPSTRSRSCPRAPRRS